MKVIGSKSICTFILSTIQRTLWIFPRINYWNGRARLDFASSRSPCTMLFSIEGSVRRRGGNGHSADSRGRGAFAWRRRDCVECHRGRDRAGEKFDDLRRLRARRGNSIFTVARIRFYIFGGSIGIAAVRRDSIVFDAIEFCHFHIGPFNPNRRAQRVRNPVWQTNDRHFRCASAARLWPALYEYANAACSHGRERLLRNCAAAPTPNKSCFESQRFCERDLFCFPQTSLSCVAKDDCRASLLRSSLGQVRKLRPNHRRRRGMPSLPMGGCLTGSLFVRPGPKRYSVRLTLSRRHASSPRRSSRQSTFIGLP